MVAVNQEQKDRGSLPQVAGLQSCPLHRTEAQALERSQLHRPEAFSSRASPGTKPRQRTRKTLRSP